MGIQADGEFDCKGLEERIIELVSDEFPKESFKLITKNKKGDEVIYCKVATDLKGNPQKVGCKIAGKKTNHGEFEDVCKVGFFSMESLRFVYCMLSRVERVDSLLKRGTLVVKLMSEITNTISVISHWPVFPSYIPKYCLAFCFGSLIASSSIYWKVIWVWIATNQS